MTIRILDFGRVGSLRSLAIFHGVAYAMSAETADTITLTRPVDPFVSIGHHQDAKTEVDLDYCPGRRNPRLPEGGRWWCRLPGRGTDFLASDLSP
jgi:hypothetical protein